MATVGHVVGPRDGLCGHSARDRHTHLLAVSVAMLGRAIGSSEVASFVHEGVHFLLDGIGGADSGCAAGEILASHCPVDRVRSGVAPMRSPSRVEHVVSVAAALDTIIDD